MCFFLILIKHYGCVMVSVIQSTEPPPSHGNHLFGDIARITRFYTQWHIPSNLFLRTIQISKNMFLNYLINKILNLFSLLCFLSKYLCFFLFQMGSVRCLEEGVKRNFKPSQMERRRKNVESYKREVSLKIIQYKMRICFRDVQSNICF